MEIFVLILKIIGILLAVCILLLGAVVAVPVRYRIFAEVQQKKAAGSAVFHWLFHIIDCRIFYGEEGFAYKLRIFGVRIGAEKAKKHKPKRRRKKKPAPALISEETETPSMDGQKKERTTGKISQDGQKKERSIEKISQDGQKGNNRSQSGKNKRKRRTKKSTKKEPIFQRIRRFKDNLKQRISGLFAEGETVKEKILNVKNIISDEKNRIVFVKIWKELKFLLRHFSPRKASGKLAFGMEDPAQTGQVLGALSVLPFWGRYHIGLGPDFEAERFYVEGNLRTKGHIRLWHFLLSAIRLIKDKNVRRLLRKIRT